MAIHKIQFCVHSHIISKNKILVANIFILSAKPLQQTINKSLKHYNNYHKLVIYQVGHCTEASSGMQYLSATAAALRVNVPVLLKVVDVDVDVVVIQ